MPARPTLLIYAKPPRIGHAKTRLAAGLGSAVTARRLASMTLSKTLRAAANGAWSARLYLDPPDAGLGGMELGFPIYAQGGGDLTDRLNKGLAEADPGPVIFVGADAPMISPALIRKAVRLLQQNDAVFGPAADGGFWLFGLNTSMRTQSPFAGVRWSTEHALADVRANLPASAKVATLETLIDLDTAEDVETWKGTPPAVSRSVESEPAMPQPEAPVETPEPIAEPAEPVIAESEPEQVVTPPAPEVEAPAAPEPTASTPTPEEKPKKKPGFFARLFGRKAA